MKLEIFGEVSKQDPIVRLKLVQDVGGGVKLIAVDRLGIRLERGNLLSINSDGQIYRHQSVNPELGFTLDTFGRVAIAPTAS